MLRVTEEAKLAPQTGSPFDRTNMNFKYRAGGHEIIPPREINKSSFSFSKDITKPDPHQFLKSKQGNGGKVNRKFTSEHDELDDSPAHATRSKFQTKSAVVPRPNPPDTELRKYYERGQIPVKIMHGEVQNTLSWTIPIESVDYTRYLPVFFDGLREVETPYSYMSELGVKDMLNAPGGGERALEAVPRLIQPIKTALNTRDKKVIARVLRMIQILVTCDTNTDPSDTAGSVENGGKTAKKSSIGLALVPYYRQLLPILSIFLHDTSSLGDKIDYGQRKRQDLGDLITETLELLEAHGGPNAFINLKYLIPTYESIHRT